MEKQEKLLSRGDFIKGVGVSTVAGVTLLGGLGSLMTACSKGADASSTSTPQWPLPYTKLDEEKVQKRAYEAYMELGG
ncbi:hypothetical protein PRVXH_001645 [Proteinivorax hydrogeniformans]|uniref:Secreted protein n=1 Tax=Proteinivorax hydrogeniformans TaxID=1826727 RepID=A0AAU8HRF9_9FIRM